MTTFSPTIKRFDVVVIPYPYGDLPIFKYRPAVVVSTSDQFHRETGHSLMAMITSAEDSSWPLDVPINDWEEAGLLKPSLARMKLFTLPHGKIRRKTGVLSAQDQHRVLASLRAFLEGEDKTLH